MKIDFKCRHDISVPLADDTMITIMIPRRNAFYIALDEHDAKCDELHQAKWLYISWDALNESVVKIECYLNTCGMIKPSHIRSWIERLDDACRTVELFNSLVNEYNEGALCAAVNGVIFTGESEGLTAYILNLIIQKTTDLEIKALLVDYLKRDAESMEGGMEL